MRLLRFILKAVMLAGVLIIGARLLFPLPSLEARIETTLVAPTEQTMLGGMILPMARTHPGQSGVLTLRRGADAFAARVILANAARETLDTQYYIWANDSSGLILLDALRRAANRGVRVRLLVDHNGTPGLDAQLAALNALDNFEVRIFNPFTLRTPRTANYLFDFPRLNRRMHNKSFTVDSVATIVGGRNIGDVYFAYGEDNLYYDMDVMAVGQAALDVSTNFDLFWNSLSSYPAGLILGADEAGLDGFDAAIAAAKADPRRQAYRQSIEASQMIRQLDAGTLGLEWVRVQMVSDDPAKGLAPVPDEQLMAHRLIDILGKVEVSLDLVSAYFIPGDILTGYLSQLAGAGVQVRTLTNSQEATDVLPVHAGYIGYRDALLDGGVEVYELKSTQDRKLTEQLGILGSSTTSLHAKTFSVDGNRVFIGSFNFDPRSARLNCEMGFLIESPTLARRMSEAFDTRMKLAAYQVFHAEDGTTIWIEPRADGEEIRYFTEPNTSKLARAIVHVVGWLPIEWML